LQKGAFIWVVEPISNAIATLSINPRSEEVISSDGQVVAIFGREVKGLSVCDILPFLDRDDKGVLEWQRVAWKAQYSTNFEDSEHERGWVPCTIEVLKTDIPCDDTDGNVSFRVSYLPHIAGVLVLDAKTLKITSSNSAFSSALFGRRNLCGLEIGEVLPNFRRLIHFLAKEQLLQRRRNSVSIRGTVTEESTRDYDEIEDSYILEEGTVVPEHAFRRAEAILELRQAAGADMTPSTSSSGSSLSTESDGAEFGGLSLGGSEEETPVNGEDSSDDTPGTTPGTNLGEGFLSSGILIKPHGLRGVHRDGGEVVVDTQLKVVRPSCDTATPDNIYYALWITYSGPRLNIPPLKPSVGPIPRLYAPSERDGFSSDEEIAPDEPRRRQSSITIKSTGIDEWDIIEDLGEGAYGSVKLVRHRRIPDKVFLLTIRVNSRPQ
jgi:protein-serine/threonine kinase